MAIVVPSLSTDIARVEIAWTNVLFPASKGPVTSIFGMNIFIPPGLKTLKSMDFLVICAQSDFKIPKYWPKITRSAIPPIEITELKRSPLIRFNVSSEYGQAVQL